MRGLFIPFLLLTASGTRLKDLCGFLKKELEELKTHFKELADIYMMKEALRSIYRTAMSVVEAETALWDWCKKALLLQSVSLHKVVKSIVGSVRSFAHIWF